MIETILLLINTLILTFTISTDDFFLAFTYALANPKLENRRRREISVIFAGLQFIAPVIGWIIIDVVEIFFNPFKLIVPYIVLVFLTGIGIKLILEGVFHKINSHHISYEFKIKGIVLHGFFTSLDALSLGMTYEGRSFYSLILMSLLLFFMTYIRSMTGLKLGKKLNAKIPFSAGIISGAVMILVGIEIFLKSKGII